MRACSALNETLKDPHTTSSILPSGSAFTRAHGQDLFVYMSAVSSVIDFDVFASHGYTHSQNKKKGLLYVFL